MKARDFFSRTRRGSWPRSAVVKRLDAIQKEVLEMLKPRMRDGEPEEDWARQDRLETYTNTSFGTSIKVSKEPR